MDEVVPKMALRRGSDAGNTEEGEPDPADDVHRRCKKNSPVYPRRQEDKTIC